MYTFIEKKMQKRAHILYYPCTHNENMQKYMQKYMQKCIQEYMQKDFTRLGTHKGCGGFIEDALRAGDRRTPTNG